MILTVDTMFITRTYAIYFLNSEPPQAPLTNLTRLSCKMHVSFLARAVFYFSLYNFISHSNTLIVQIATEP